ncbi:phosphatidylserine decarboxylase proenzyme, mitochondrial [Ischnura elegans]|uniref:phosphatidylserine decarboxylase proenzyme, mitochondrial n=1 Tax=Ischnura elegans TaxID=197161 RepID=UPI001ED88093|nr:phosphatidylserine decarboxylase proenzyme, mitochondrial [Ischnura elegans]
MAAGCSSIFLEFGGTWQRLRNSSVVRYVRGLEWTPLPLGVGFALLAVLQWRHIRNRARKTPEGTEAVSDVKEWEITCYRMMPLRAFSRAWGWALGFQLPTWARSPILSAYASTFGCNLSEAAYPDLSSYSSLGEFFCRSLKDGCRPIDAAQPLVSPADGKVLNFGPVESCRVEQVKGVTYSLETFLGPPVWEELSVSDQSTGKIETMTKETMPKCLLHDKNNCLYQCVIYLAPGDYHRFHSPVDWNIKFRRHFQGELLSVNPRVARWIPDLFSLNERAMYVGSWKYGFFSTTAVGATNVGSIKIYCDKTLHTNERKWKLNRSEDKFFQASGGGVSLKKGDPFGEFNLGSTIVLLFEAPKDFKFNVSAGQVVKVGQPLHCECSSSEKSK